PGRADQPQAAVVKKQMRAGSTLVAFEVKGGRAAAFRTLNALKLSRISNNLGDAKSLVTHPTTTTHQRLTEQARAELGITEGLIRFSAGLEHPEDLIEDLYAALETAGGRLGALAIYPPLRGPNGSAQSAARWLAMTPWLIQHKSSRGN